MKMPPTWRSPGTQRWRAPFTATARSSAAGKDPRTIVPCHAWGCCIRGASNGCGAEVQLELLDAGWVPSIEAEAPLCLAEQAGRAQARQHALVCIGTNCISANNGRRASAIFD